MTVPQLSAPGPRYPLTLGLASVAWAVAGWLLAATAPGLAFVPGVEGLHVLLPSITAGLILANLAFAIRALVRDRVSVDRLFLVTGLQVGLFTTLFFQLAAHQGAELYRLDRPAAGWDWAQFSLAHALRASDVLDVIEAYGLKTQTIKHQGWIVACAVVTYHVVIDLFVLGVIWELIRVGTDYLLRDRAAEAWAYQLVGGAILSWLVAWVACVFWLRPWRAIDIPIWLGENALRVVDFADVMDSFDIRWHQVPREWAESTLTFFYRVWIALGLSVWAAARQAVHGQAGAAASVEPLSLGRLPRLGGAVVLLAVLLGVDGWAGAGKDQRLADLVAAAIGADEAKAEQALTALRRLGPDAGPAVGELLAAADRSPGRQAKIIDTVGWLGAGGVGALQERALAPNRERAAAAVQALCHVGPRAAPALAEVWAHTPDPGVQAVAADGLSALGTDAVPWLMEQTGRENSATHLHWFEELDRNWRLRVSENETVQALKRLRELHGLLSKPKDFLAVDWQPYGSAGVQVLLALLIDDNEATRRGAALALGQLRSSLRYATGELLRALTHEDRDIRRGAVMALANVADPDPNVVAGVLGRLDDPDREVRRSTTVALGMLTPEATAALPSLTRAMGDPDGLVREGAVRAMGRLRGDPVPGLVAALANPAHRVRSLAADALAYLGPEARDALAALTRALEDRDREVRRRAAKAIASLGPDAVSTMAAGLSHPDAGVCRVMADGLRKLGPDARPAIKALADALQHQDLDVAYKASEALACQGRAAVPSLVKALDAPHRLTRAFAAGALGRMGQEAREAVEALRLMAKTDPDRQAREAAGYALNALKKISR